MRTYRSTSSFNPRSPRGERLQSMQLPATPTFSMAHLRTLLHYIQNLDGTIEAVRQRIDSEEVAVNANLAVFLRSLGVRAAESPPPIAFGVLVKG